MPLFYPELSSVRTSEAGACAERLGAFEPQWWLRNAYVQSCFPFFVRRGTALRLERERWETPDGDFVDVDLCRPREAPRGFVLLLHGLEGSSRARYMLGTLERCVERRLLGISVNFRTCSGTMNRLLRAYHSGDSDELRFFVAETRRRYPGLPGGVIGFSLGGNVLVKWLAEEGAAVPPEVRGAVAVSVPFDIRGVALANDRPQRWLVREFFLRTLRAKALWKAARFPGALDPAAVRAATTIRAFDDAVTAPLHGFRDAEDYWRRASAGPLVGAIKRPCLVMAANDDPIVPSSVIPRDAIRKNPHLTLEETARGGHVGFVAGTARAPRFYAEERAVRWLEEKILG
jgi:predicted alpha/beta-fold hydrolase